MPFSADAVANYFLDKARESGEGLSPMKLQKLLYFAHGWHLALDAKETPLIDEHAQAWEYGPVFPSVYHEFKQFGSGDITDSAYDVKSINGKISVFAPSIDDEAAQQGIDASFAKAVLDRVWKVYSRHSAGALSDKTHERESPWWKVRENARKQLSGRPIPRGLNIPNETICSWFKTAFQKTAG